MSMLDTIPYETLPNRMLEQGLRHYFEHGIMPGSFLTAALCGDLFTAVRYADPTNQETLARLVWWLISNAPTGCYGSPEAVQRYAEARRAARLQQTD